MELWRKPMQIYYAPWNWEGNSKLSECIFSNVGVKRADPSSSLLCLFFLNDILDNIDTNIPGLLDIDDLKIVLLLFADDAVLFAENPLFL